MTQENEEEEAIERKIAAMEHESKLLEQHEARKTRLAELESKLKKQRFARTSLGKVAHTIKNKVNAYQAAQPKRKTKARNTGITSGFSDIGTGILGGSTKQTKKSGWGYSNNDIFGNKPKRGRKPSNQGWW